MMIKRFVVTLLMIVISIMTSQAQVPSPTFEVVSVRVSTSSEPGGVMNTQPGRVSARNVTLRSLILNAYRVRDSQVDTGGVPGWVANDRFDVEATMAASATADEIAQMMQALLADRFKLAVRREMRELPAYSLGPARPDGAPGPALRATQAAQCAEGVALQAGAAAPRCGGVMFNPGRLVGRAVSWTQIVTALSGVPAVGRLVVDGGSRAGLFDFELRWTPANRAGGAGPADAPDSIFTALQEQLGLKLTAQCRHRLRSSSSRRTAPGCQLKLQAVPATHSGYRHFEAMGTPKHAARRASYVLAVRSALTAIGSLDVCQRAWVACSASRAWPVVSIRGRQSHKRASTFAIVGAPLGK
jgi:uncharacterized protein (TIGR03435 family)